MATGTPGNAVGRLVQAVRVGYSSFRKEYIAGSADSRRGIYGSGYGTRDARQLRYSLWWAFWENSAYDVDSNLGSPKSRSTPGVHSWGESFQTQMDLYRSTRGVLNPAFRLGEFWATHMMGGILDPAAGDGSSRPTCLPILDADETLRAAIAHCWKLSDWQNNKTDYARKGAVLGDVALAVVDDTDPELPGVWLEVQHPGLYVDVKKNRRGEVVYYVREEFREDPLEDPPVLESAGRVVKTCVYTETAELTPAGVLYKTYRNYEPYAWNGQADTWLSPYTFVPVSFVQHVDVNLGWGYSEFHNGLMKALEDDDQVSKLNDQVRKSVEGSWLYAGVLKKHLEDAEAEYLASLDDRRKDRNRVRYIAANDPNARAYSLVTNLDILGASTHLRWMTEQHLQDYPELRYELIKGTGDATAKALTEARKPAEAKVQERRARYDAGLVRAMKMCIAIGGMRHAESGHENLAPYAGYGLGDFRGEKLDFSIGEREVFQLTEADRQQQEIETATQVKLWVDSGVDLLVALKRAGWPEEDIASVEKYREQQKQEMMDRAQALTEMRAASQGRDPSRPPAAKAEDQPKNARSPSFTRAATAAIQEVSNQHR